MQAAPSPPLIASSRIYLGSPLPPRCLSRRSHRFHRRSHPPRSFLLTLLLPPSSLRPLPSALFLSPSSKIDSSVGFLQKRFLRCGVCGVFPPQDRCDLSDALFLGSPRGCPYVLRTHSTDFVRRSGPKKPCSRHFKRESRLCEKLAIFSPIRGQGGRAPLWGVG